MGGQGLAGTRLPAELPHQGRPGAGGKPDHRIGGVESAGDEIRSALQSACVQSAHAAHQHQEGRHDEHRLLQQDDGSGRRTGGGWQEG